jgi:hypothetical protein
VVVLNGLPIILEIVVLKSFIGVVLKTYCSIRADTGTAWYLILALLAYGSFSFSKLMTEVDMAFPGQSKWCTCKTAASTATEHKSCQISLVLCYFGFLL